jgi:hypothetical protein
LENEASASNFSSPSRRAAAPQAHFKQPAPLFLSGGDRVGDGAEWQNEPERIVEQAHSAEPQ